MFDNPYSDVGLTSTVVRLLGIYRLYSLVVFLDTYVPRYNTNVMISVDIDVSLR